MFDYNAVTYRWVFIYKCISEVLNYIVNGLQWEINYSHCHCYFY